MTSLTLRATGQASADVVWERYDDLALWTSWAPQIQRVDASDDRLRPGLTGTVHAGLLPWPTLPVSFEVVSVDRSRREWSWRPRVGSVSLLLEHGVVEGGTWLRVVGPAPLVLPYAPVARLALGRLVRA